MEGGYYRVGLGPVKPLTSQHLKPGVDNVVRLFYTSRLKGGKRINLSVVVQQCLDSRDSVLHGPFGPVLAQNRTGLHFAVRSTARTRTGSL
jgi:hypothetical protein